VIVKTIGLFEAKQKLSELVERVSTGEQIGITRRGKLAAMIVPVRPKKVWTKFGQTWKTFANALIVPSSPRSKN